MDSWKPLFALLLVTLFCGCASEQKNNSNYTLQDILQAQQRQIQRQQIALDLSTLPEQDNPFRNTFGQRRVANNPNDPIEVSLVGAYNKNLHDKEMDAWVAYELSQSAPKQSMVANFPFGINRTYNQPSTSSTDYTQQYNSPNTVRPNAYGLGVNADQYGRPSTYQLQNGQQLDPIFNEGVKQNVYGPGIGQDQFGRPVYNSPP
jgi:hypothetical protein